MKNRNIVIAVIVVVILLCICCVTLSFFAVSSGAINTLLNLGSSSSSSSSVSSSLSSSVSSSDTSVYTNSTYDFSLEYPSDWELQENTDGVTAQFLSPLDAAVDGFHENLNFSVNPVTSTPDYDEYVSGLVNGSVGDAGTFQLESNDDITFMGVTARSVTYTVESNGLELQGSQLYFTKNNLLFIFTYTGETGSYTQYLDQANQIMASLQFN